MFEHWPVDLIYNTTELNELKMQLLDFRHYLVLGLVPAGKCSKFENLLAV